MTLEWNYNTHCVDVSMPGYVAKALHNIHHTTPSKPQHSPFKCVRPNYGSKVQYAPEPDNSPFLSASGNNHVQQIVGNFFYYRRAIDNSMIPAFISLSTSQSKPTSYTNQYSTQFLDYVATYPTTIIRYYRSGMILYVHSDVPFLC